VVTIYTEIIIEVNFFSLAMIAGQEITLTGKTEMQITLTEIMVMRAGKAKVINRMI